MTEPIKARQVALLGAMLVGADALLKAENRYVEDVRRDVLRNLDRGMHRTKRRVRKTATRLEVVLIALVVLTAIGGETRERRRSLREG